MPKKKTEVSVSKKKIGGTAPKTKADNRGWIIKLADGLMNEGCPKCHKSGGEKTGQREVGVSHLTETKIETVQDEHLDPMGKLIHTTERSVPVLVTMRIRTYHQDYRCYLCGHKWSERKEDKKEI